MNLPLHYGMLGVLEAMLIALGVGVLAYLLWHWLSHLFRFSNAHAIGWACVTAVLAGAGVDAWNLFYLGMSRLESPLYARIALASIHDADSLGARVACEILGALAGVVLAWLAFSRRSASRTLPQTDRSHENAG